MRSNLALTTSMDPQNPLAAKRCEATKRVFNNIHTKTLVNIVGPKRLSWICHVRIGKAFLIRATHGRIFDKNHMKYIYSPITNSPFPPFWFYISKSCATHKFFMNSTLTQGQLSGCAYRLSGKTFPIF